MILRIAAVIAAGLAGAGFITLASAWYAGSSTSLDPKVRRRVQLAEGIMYLALLLLAALSAANARDRKVAQIMLAVVIGVGLFRGAWLFLAKRRT
jgi:hypothetical protein